MDLIRRVCGFIRESHKNITALTWICGTIKYTYIIGSYVIVVTVMKLLHWTSNWIIIPAVIVAYMITSFCIPDEDKMKIATNKWCVAILVFRVLMASITVALSIFVENLYVEDANHGIVTSISSALVVCIIQFWILLPRAIRQIREDYVRQILEV